MRSAADYIEHLQTNGRLTFTTEEAVCALDRSVAAVRAQLRRLKQKGHIVDPYRGFHVVVPPRYRRLGCLPAEQFVPQLMAHLDEPYYVALLSAAAYHGAAHQAPMSFQVMVAQSRRGLSCNGVRVDFVARQDMQGTPIVERNVPTGALRIATPAATALEIVGYPERCGYLDNVATVLSELAESIDGDALTAEARRAPLTWVQRLGYLLVLIGHDELAERLDERLQGANVFTAPLAPWQKVDGAHRDARWHLAINSDVAPDA